MSGAYPTGTFLQLAASAEWHVWPCYHGGCGSESFLLIQVFFSVWMYKLCRHPCLTWHHERHQLRMQFYTEKKCNGWRVNLIPWGSNTAYNESCRQYRHLFLFDKCGSLIKGTLQKFENYLFKLDLRTFEAPEVYLAFIARCVQSEYGFCVTGNEYWRWGMNTLITSECW